MSDPLTPPNGYRLIDPAKDGPKRWDDLVWSVGVSGRWLQITCEVGEEVGPFYANSHYARRIADNELITAIAEDRDRIRMAWEKAEDRIEELDAEIERLGSRQN